MIVIARETYMCFIDSLADKVLQDSMDLPI